VDYISQFKEEVDKELEIFFQRRLSGKSGIEREVISCLREFTLRGGKRIRPLFMLLGYWLNSDIDREAIRASISLELMQSYLLIHDDIIDQSDLRRGGPTFHKLFKYDDRINEGIAIVSADLADAFSHEALLSSHFPPDSLNRAMNIMAETIELTGVGQLMDIVLPLGNEMTIDDVTAIHKLKTAQYTVNGPMKMGAVLSGYSNMEKIDSYGISLGIAFQIQDDILGMFGDEKVLGKSVKSDFEEGKKTHLILYTYQLAGEREKEFIRRNLGRKHISDEDFEKVREIIEKSGALDKTRELSEKYYKQAVSSIDDLTEDGKKRDELLKMAEKMVKRIS
jgi:geranylgeranyl diphosphate synthase type I